MVGGERILGWLTEVDLNLKGSPDEGTSVMGIVRAKWCMMQFTQIIQICPTDVRPWVTGCQQNKALAHGPHTEESQSLGSVHSPN